MKVKVINRHPLTFNSFDANEVQKKFKNPNPLLHPFENEREYARTVVAVKMDKIFAKPFVASMDGHTDAVQCISKGHKTLSDIFTGSCDGEIRFWNLNAHKCYKSIRGHTGFVRGLCTSGDDRWLFSCGDDRRIKQWNIEKNREICDMDLEELQCEGHLVKDGDVTALNVDVKPSNSFLCGSALNGVDHHYRKPLIVSCGDKLDVWDHHRSNPIQTFDWGTEKVLAAKFNPSERELVVASAADNSIALYDLRGNTALRKIILRMKSNAVCWNPMQPINFTVANEDHNLYTFDMRRLDIALSTHVDFTNAVLDVDYSPTGLEFVASSFDRTIRIFENRSGRSRDVYHTKRMQHVSSCRFTADSRYVISGSSDFCVRIWKANASAPVGPQTYKERQAIDYRNALKEKYKNVKEIKRIARHRHVPSLIKSITERKREIETAEHRKEENRRLHVKQNKPFAAMRKKSIIREEE